ncbi:MAG: hypothetical protein ACQEP9_03515 [Bacillota bacterium]
MYKIKSKEDFIIVTGSNIIKDSEAKSICKEVVVKLEQNGKITDLILDLRKVDLEESKFDIFINYLSKIELERVALIVPELISSLKFKLWKRKYKKFIQLAQFNNLSSAKRWLVEGR